MQWLTAVTIAALVAALTPVMRAQTVDTSSAVTVPSGTRVPLKLVTEIHNRSTKPGDAVKAQVAFPIMVGTHVAIPADTWVEGTVLSVKASGRQHQPQVQMHFTRLIFVNGYSVPLDAANTQALLVEPELGRTRATVVLADAVDGMPLFGEGQTQPTLPALPSNGPNPAVIAGVMLGSTAAITTIAILVARHHSGHADYLLFASGWQFEIELAQPLTIDLARISASAGAQ